MKRARAGRKKGHPVSDESRKKMSESHIGLKPSAESIKKRSEAMKKVWRDLKIKAGEIEEESIGTK